MIARQSSKLASYQHLEEALNDNQSVFETDESTKAQIMVFTGYHTRLRTLRNDLNEPTQWITKAKRELFEELSDNSKLVIVALIRFANDTNNQELINKLDTIQEKLLRTSQSIRLDAAEQLHDLALENQTELANYSITAEFITAYKKCMDDIEDKNAERIRIKEQNKLNKKEFEELIRTTDIFLKEKLDWSIESYRVSHPDMVNAYFSARKLQKTNTSHIDVRGFIVDKETGSAISYGEVSVVENDMQTKITKNGYFSFKNFPDGEFTLKVENINYETTMITIRRYSNQYLNIKVEMQPQPVPHPA
ncbi:carboxypeptidase-like regulatory domain-containing protein [Marinifilum sp. D714]|uniref:carboxypeptidase-like regulatory domain-containing protein n=1 Tax=Marinifilum sp. D714 TaxID=2937523 RepID=UPI0027C01336|nr:carboxypeptidase-like regulatory domain-containing protein [Marinifilum sp. D714]MDQ2178050.1 carboxypeptidase-like regulatory domain-containing protein [Marinifilum sp. D714]